ncbi:MAG: hypothetical protein KF720_11775 [Rubrivivax sp.]|nr:hypothetical protein [Rubrivivax sp.]
MRFTPLAAPLLSLTLAVLPVAAGAQAQEPDKTPKAAATDGDYWRLMGSPYTVHYHKDTDNEHQPVYMIGLERQRSDGWVWGGTYFSNSFGQPSGYVYVGEKVMGFSRWDKLFFQWTAGILYGYKEPYEDKVPFNHNGFSPGVTASLGWQFTREFSMQAIALGAAGLMFQAAWDFR